MTQAAELDFRFEVVRPKLEAFLHRELGKSVQFTSTAQRLAAGLSWLTYGATARIGDAPPQDLIVRIGDPAGLLAPYRAEPEYRVLSALHGTPQLAIPRTIAFTDDPSVVGAPIFVTTRVAGDTPGPWTGVLLESPELIASLARDFATNLVAIHQFDWEKSDLHAFWGNVKGDQGAQNEIKRWAAHAYLEEGGGAPQMHYAQRWLEDHAPVAERVTIAHGDYRVGNFLSHEGRISAILDWELVHAGDPHEDLAWAAARTFSAGTDKIGGLFDREELHRRYSEATGLVINPRSLHFYAVLAQFKMAAMLVRANRRVERREARDVRVAAMAYQVGPTLMEVNRLISAGVPR